MRPPPREMGKQIRDSDHSLLIFSYCARSLRYPSRNRLRKLSLKCQIFAEIP